MTSTKKEDRKPITFEELREMSVKLSGKIEGLEVRRIEDFIFFVCECKNIDQNKFSKYQRGGNFGRADTFIMCGKCNEKTVHIDVLNAKLEILHKEIEESLKPKKNVKKGD